MLVAHGEELVRVNLTSMKQKGIAGCLEIVFHMNNVKFLVNRTVAEINVKQNTVMCGFARGKWAFVDGDTPLKEKDVPYTLEDSWV